jgi:hypothetical protein
MVVKGAAGCILQVAQTVASAEVELVTAVR